MLGGDKRRSAASGGSGRAGKSRGAKPTQMIWQHGDRGRTERIDPMRRRVEFALL